MNFLYDLIQQVFNCERLIRVGIYSIDSLGML